MGLTLSWLKRLWRTDAPEEFSGAEESGDQSILVHLGLAGWCEVETQGTFRAWRDSQGAALSCAVLPDCPWLPDQLAHDIPSQHWARCIAEDRNAGLVELRTSLEEPVPTVRLIYKRLEKPAYIFTGMLFMPLQQTCLLWTVIAGEQGTTGVREAVIAAELMNSGELTLDGYKRSWARDPYSDRYDGVDRSVLCFISDGERYDEPFPEHPLSRVRRTLSALPSSIELEVRS